MVLSLFMITTIPWIFYFKEFHLINPIILSIVITFIFGFLLFFFTRKNSTEFHLKDGYIVVSLAWILMGLAGSLPFYLSGSMPSLIDAIFESVSGFTTTGSSILTDIEAQPKSILFWRSLTHWIGGMGIIVLVIAILPSLKIAGYQLFSMETTGISSDKIKPRTSDIAKRLWIIYVSLTVLLTFLLILGGMNFFESLCHSFGTIATGGFSPKNSSIGLYSNYIQYIITGFMILSGINFALHYYLLKGRLDKIKENSELKAFLLIILFIGFLITIILHFEQDLPFEKSFRDSFFQVASIITATGYATTDYLEWKEIAWILIFLLMFVGACVGSTGGGIKVIRHVVALKNIRRYFLRLLHPNLIKQIHINGQIISDEKSGSIITFIGIYLLIVAFSTLVMASMGLDGKTSMGAVLATLGGIGPGIGTVGPASNFAHIPDFGKLYLSFIMIIGRLEILTFLVLFTPTYWKK